MALSQLRGLVQTLRGRVEGPVAVTASASLMETVEEVDELLTGHGFWVELDTSAAFRSRPPSAAGRLLGELVRAAGACILARAEPGDQCALIISHDDGEVHLRFVSPCVTDSHDLLRGAATHRNNGWIGAYARRGWRAGFHAAKSCGR